MGWQMATLIAWNGTKGIAYNEYDEAIRFESTAVHKSDRPALKPGMRILRFDNGSIELASQSFLRYNEEKMAIYECDTVIIPLVYDVEDNCD
jgi:hypothetical protein